MTASFQPETWKELAEALGVTRRALFAKAQELGDRCPEGGADGHNVTEWRELLDEDVAPRFKIEGPYMGRSRRIEGVIDCLEILDDALCSASICELASQFDYGRKMAFAIRLILACECDRDDVAELLEGLN